MSFLNTKVFTLFVQNLYNFVVKICQVFFDSLRQQLCDVIDRWLFKSYTKRNIWFDDDKNIDQTMELLYFDLDQIELEIYKNSHYCPTTGFSQLKIQT